MYLAEDPLARSVENWFKWSLVLEYMVCATTTVPTIMPSKAPAKRAAPAPVPNNQKDRLRRRNSLGVRTSDSDRIVRSRLRTLAISASGARRTRKYVALFGGVPIKARAWSR